MAETDTAAVSVLHADTMRSADMMNHLKILVHERCCSFNVVMNTVHRNNHTFPDFADCRGMRDMAAVLLSENTNTEKGTFDRIKGLSSVLFITVQLFLVDIALGDLFPYP